MNDESMYCVLCKKQLKTARGYQSHLKSKTHLKNVDRADVSNITKLDNYKNYIETLPSDIEIKRVFDDYSHSEYKRVFSEEDEPITDVRYLYQHNSADTNDNIYEYDESVEADETFYDILTNFYNIFRKSFKCYMNVEVLYTKMGSDDIPEEIVQGHFTQTQEIHNVYDIEPIFVTMINRLKDAIIEAQLRESGWRLVRIISKK